MSRLLSLLLVLPFSAALAEPKPILPASVVVLYNSAQPESKKLAETYAQARSIPAENLLGLPLSTGEEISRAEYDKSLKEPLRQQFDAKGWWVRQKDPAGNLLPMQMKIRFLVCMRGVPSRIARVPGTPEPKQGEPPYTHANEAAVDSELALGGIDGVPIDGPLSNPYYNKDYSYVENKTPMLLVGRIDAATWETCNRMIKDAVETEKTGLWGMATIDLSKKYPQGDQWLENIVTEHGKLGIPTLVDRFPDTLPLNYPLKDAAIYYGWYDWHVSGPFLNAGFKFRKGAVAVHLHSFSAAQLRDPQQNWCAPLLERGAAVTLGNVFEPYLEMTHHFDIFQDRLLKGYSVAEAAYMAIPVLSWQNVVLGDPLYRPFLHIDGSGDKADADREYRVIKLAYDRWSSDPTKLDTMLHEASEKMKSGVLSEGIGLMESAKGLDSVASVDFQKAKSFYKDKADLLRIDLHMATIERNAGKTSAAIKLLKEAKQSYAGIPESAAASAWLNIIDPPAPPPAKAK